MKTEKKNSSGSLEQNGCAFPWELMVLLMLLVTVIGVALRGPVKNFPHRDPYDLRADRTVVEVRNRVETGL